jgi:ankyrin repeat protein
MLNREVPLAPHEISCKKIDFSLQHSNEKRPPEARDEFGRIPLLWASYGGWVEVVELLRVRDVDTEASDKLGRTAVLGIREWAPGCGEAPAGKRCST